MVCAGVRRRSTLRIAASIRIDAVSPAISTPSYKLLNYRKEKGGIHQKNSDSALMRTHDQKRPADVPTSTFDGPWTINPSAKEMNEWLTHSLLHLTNSQLHL